MNAGSAADYVSAALHQTPKTTVTVHLDPDTADRLDTLAERLGKTRSELRAAAVAIGLEALEAAEQEQRRQQRGAK